MGILMSKLEKDTIEEILNFYLANAQEDLRLICLSSSTGLFKTLYSSVFQVIKTDIMLLALLTYIGSPVLNSFYEWSLIIVNLHSL